MGGKSRLSRYVEIFGNKKGFSLLHKTNRFRVAVRLIQYRSQKTLKCGKNISGTLGCASCGTFFCLPHFDVICEQTRGKWLREMVCNVLVRDQNIILLASLLVDTLFTKRANQALKYI